MYYHDEQLSKPHSEDEGEPNLLAVYAGAKYQIAVLEQQLHLKDAGAKRKL